MKKYLSLFLIGLALSACKSENQTSENQESEEIAPETIQYSLIASESSAKWTRHLHEGPSKKKVKLFGADVEIEMGEVNLTTNGEADVKDGTLSQLEDEYTKLEMTFDMKTFQINTDMKDKKDDLFKSKDYPESSIAFSSISKKDDGYELKGDLSIAGTTKPITANGKIKTEGEKHIFNGNLTINTLDFPLRSVDAAKITKEDKVDVELQLTFK